MPVYVALLRAVNVGGTGRLSMSDLRSLCEAAGFENVATYIQSGNVVLRSPQEEAQVRTTIEEALCKKMGAPIDVFVRTLQQLATTLDSCPFTHAPPNQVVVFFLHAEISQADLAAVSIPGREQLAAHGREVFVYYPDSISKSKLKLPFAKASTGRNLNTVTKLEAIARAAAR